MKNINHKFAVGMLAGAALILPAFLGGCDREVARTSETKVKSDGSTKSEETVVRQSPDGTVTKEQSKTSTPPAPNP